MKRPCSQPGCNALLDASGYCQEHQASAPKRHALYDQSRRRNDPALEMAARIRSSARWHAVRRSVLEAQPLCADPFGVHAQASTTRSSTQVHHIKGLIAAPDLAFVADNLMPICSACHARIEREVRRSGDG
jgi:hypothetical protein